MVGVAGLVVLQTVAVGLGALVILTAALRLLVNEQHLLRKGTFYLLSFRLVDYLV
jgi:uncharacterized membrane protein